ncbi:MAG: response regulator [Proteobacteria bacterium]|nr:response regulator [Pseudomonadota bacterium]
MEDMYNTKKQLIDELQRLRQRNIELEKLEIEHKQLEDLVIRAKQEWEYTFDSVPDLIALIDGQHRIMRVNKAMADKLDLSPKEMVGMPCYKSVHDMETPPVFCPHTLLLEDGQIHNAELQVEAFGGFFSVTVSPLYDEKGNLIASVHVARDITELKMAEDALKDSENYLKSILNSVQTGVMLIDVDEHKIVYANPAAITMIGTNEKNVIGKTCHTFICPAEKGKCPISDLKQTVDNSDRILINANSERIPIIKTVVPIKISGHAYYLESFVDITERKGAEERIQEQVHFLQVLIDSIPAPVFYKDLHGLYVGCNRGFESHLGLLKEQIIGKSVYDVMTKEVAEQIDKMDMALYREPGIQRYETTVAHPDGSNHDVVFSKATYIDRKGSITGLVGVILDITDLKKTEIALRKAKEEAEVANRAKSEFLASMSHEIRTPMNAIIGMAELLMDTPLTSEQEKYVQVSRGAGENLLGLINDILDLSKVEAGQINLEHISFDLMDVIERTYDILALRANEKALELTCHVSPDIPAYLIGDPTRLRQVLVNLIGNAIKFTEKGEVVVEVSKQGSEKEVQGLSDSKSKILNSKSEIVTLLFSVRDTGIGIPDEKINMIFEKFTQADASTTRRYGGTGLGLTISKRIIHLMEGEIRAESKVNVGTTMFFTACFNIQEGLKEEKTLPYNVNLKDVKVLVIDDNATNRMILREMLSSFGAQVTEAENGKTGLEILEHSVVGKELIGLVFLDYHMPDMDGFEVAERIKKNEQLKHVSVIILTSGFSKSDKEMAHQFNITSILFKPIKRAELREAINIAMHYIPHKDDGAQAHVVQPSPGEKEVLHVLIVDDNEDNRLLFWSYFKNTLHKTDLAENGLVALKKFTEGQGKYDLVLMDMQMPIMDGYTATSQIRAWEKKNGLEPTPIIALTAYAMKEDIQKSLGVGCNGHITKPVKKTQFLEAVAAYAKRK